MQKKTHSSHKAKKSYLRQTQLDRFIQKPWLVLLTLYVVSVAIRSILAFTMSTNPTVFIDEGLYINIARSLFHDGTVMYRGQPIEYVYLLYPIFLMPLFVLPASVSLYRAAQILNSLLICSSVFPAYLIGKALKLEKRQSLLVAAATMLIPEMCYSLYLVAENLVYPFMMWTFVLAILVANRRDRPWIPCWILGVLTGLSYFLKPICVVFGLTFFLCLLISGAHNRHKKSILAALTGLVLAGACIGTGYALYRFFFGHTTLLSLYDKQIPALDAQTVFFMVQGFLFHLMALVFACGGGFILMPVIARRCLKQPLMLYTTLTGTILSCIGIAVMIVPYQFTGSVGISPVHLRYLMFFFPLIFALFLDNDLLDYRHPSKAGIVVLLIFTAFFVFPSAFRMFNYQAGSYDAPSLNAFYSDRAGVSMGILLILVLTPCMCMLIRQLSKKGWTSATRSLVCLTTLCFMLLNGIFAYTNRRSAEPISETEATELSEKIDGQNALIITNNRYDDFRGYLLDVHLHDPAQMLVANNLFLGLIDTAGIYVPITPVVQSPNTASIPTVQTDTIAFDLTVADYVEFTDDVTLWKTENGYYTVAKIDPQKPFLKSALASMDAYFLNAGEIASLIIYDTEILSRGFVTLSINMRSATGSNCTVAFSSEGVTQEVTVSPANQAYEVTLPISQCNFFCFTLEATDTVIVNEYSTR